MKTFSLCEKKGFDWAGPGRSLPETRVFGAPPGGWLLGPFNPSHDINPRRTGKFNKSLRFWNRGGRFCREEREHHLKMPPLPRWRCEKNNGPMIPFCMFRIGYNHKSCPQNHAWDRSGLARWGPRFVNRGEKSRTGLGRMDSGLYPRGKR